MEIKIHEQDGVIIRSITGEVNLAEMVESWNMLFAKYPSLKEYKGILANFLDAKIKLEDKNLNSLVEFLKNNLEQLKDLKIAVVMDTPMVTNTIIISQRVRSLQIKPFTTVEAAIRWINY